PQGGGGSYNAVTNFSGSQNPTGAWSYGYRTPAGVYGSYPSNSNIFGSGTSSWSQPSLAWCCPSLTKNTTGGTLAYGSIVQPADVLNLHPGPNGERSVLRWTAPGSGSYQLSGRFQGLDSGAGTTTDVLIQHNGVTIYSGAINGYGNQLQYSLNRSVAAMDVIEFSVGVGSNGTFNSDSTGVAATITQTSGEPSDLTSARLDPFNQSGDQLRARDVEWSLPILSLPGRAGLDLGLTLSYSSLVWTRAGNYMYFDRDNGSPSPGFRIGFPTVQGP